MESQLPLKLVPIPVIALYYVMMISWFSHIRLLSFIFEEYACSHMCIIIIIIIAPSSLPTPPSFAVLDQVKLVMDITRQNTT